MARLSINAIRKSFGSTEVLKGVGLDIADGEFMTLVGPSGCGKSSLLRIIAGLEHQTAGEIHIDGHRVDHLRPKDRDLAMVFQSYALYPHLTVFDNIALPLRMRRLSRLQRLPLLGRAVPGRGAVDQRIGHEVGAVARLLEIGPLLDRKPGQLSGGQRQRVALGRAMVRAPKAFLMDEPLSNLDAKLRVQMRAEIAQLHRRLGATFIYVTHDQAEAMTMSDRVALMMGGEIVQVAPPDELYRNPADIRVAEFIGSPKMNMLSATADSGRIAAGEQILLRGMAVPDGILTVGIRPEAVQLLPETGDGIPGRVTYVENMGADLFVHVDSPVTATPVLVRLDSERHARPPVGSPVRLGLPADRVLLFDAHGRRLRPGSATPAVVEAVHG